MSVDSFGMVGFLFLEDVTLTYVRVMDRVNHREKAKRREADDDSRPRLEKTMGVDYGAAATIARTVQKSLSMAPMLMYQH